jgi:molybdopterin-guanine dinucleotide biosynthesis protein MobB
MMAGRNDRAAAGWRHPQERIRLDLLPAPVLAVCGWSGSGKTTLLEAAIPRLAARGLKVAVVKHDAHGIQVDREGKDSDRLFRAGATVVLRAPEESFARLAASPEATLAHCLWSLAKAHDLLLVEGHKDTPLPKVWLVHRQGTPAPEKIQPVLATLPWGGERLDPFLHLAEECVQRHFAARPVLGGVLVGGASSRMGRPKHLAKVGGQTLLQRACHALAPHALEVVLLGRAEGAARRPWLPDVPGIHGPLAGMLSALRWHPCAAWLIAACDMPNLDADALAWVLAQRRPGRWAVIPADPDGRLEPLAAVWEPQAAPLLNDLVLHGQAAPRLAARHAKVATPPLPAELRGAFRNVNTPGDLAALRRSRRRGDAQPPVSCR